MLPCLALTTYKVRIKVKVKQSREWSRTPQYLGIVAIKKGAFGSLATKVSNFTYMHQPESFQENQS